MIPTIIPKITILDAINFVVKAWDCVTMRTVISSWTRADILPVSLPSIPGTYATEEIEEIEKKDYSNQCRIGATNHSRGIFDIRCVVFILYTVNFCLINIYIVTCFNETIIKLNRTSL